MATVIEELDVTFHLALVMHEPHELSERELPNIPEPLDSMLV